MTDKTFFFLEFITRDKTQKGDSLIIPANYYSIGYETSRTSTTKQKAFS